MVVNRLHERSECIHEIKTYKLITKAISRFFRMWNTSELVCEENGFTVRLRVWFHVHDCTQLLSINDVIL